MSGECVLQYFPFASYVAENFWHKLSQIKLDIDRLDEKVRPIWGSYSNLGTWGQVEPPRLCVDCTAYNQNFEALPNLLPAHGYHLNRNTLETFKNCDKTALLEEQGAHFWDQIISGTVLEDPSLLTRFFLLTFGDLKKYQFYYWFAFLAPRYPTVKIVRQADIISKTFSSSQIESLEVAYKGIVDVKQRGYFIVKLGEESVEVFPLAKLKSLFSEGKNTEELYLSFADPCLKAAPSWPLRNLMAAFTYHCPHMINRDVSILCLRLHSMGQTCPVAQSLIITVQPQAPEESGIKWIGWERNNRGKLGPRVADARNNMDPSRLAESAVHLNLKLMKWRLVPELDLDVVRNTRCLLMGAGTLGCTVARTLMAWGVNHITFVDNGKVSYSNPVRQSLFSFEDSLNGGRSKAVAAADALKRIYPNVKAFGAQLNIPMPGHTVGDSLLEETREAVSTLEKLVEEHDVVFMLTDSRESRWLPTVLAGSKGKLALNAALGFDSYLVMRHGFKSGDDAHSGDSVCSSTLRSVQGRELGCYFCNDVTAPGNSMIDRTLDQQCTVTRPGVAAIAGALVVELLVSVLQHPLKGNACADLNDANSAHHSTSVLGPVPHSIRGFLSSWEELKPSMPRFQNCIACSRKVLDEYASRRFDFILDVLNSSSFLEDLTGLTEMHRETENCDITALTDSEDEELCID